MNFTCILHFWYYLCRYLIVIRPIKDEVVEVLIIFHVSHVELAATRHLHDPTDIAIRFDAVSHFDARDCRRVRIVRHRVQLQLPEVDIVACFAHFDGARSAIEPVTIKFHVVDVGCSIIRSFIVLIDVPD